LNEIDGFYPNEFFITKSKIQGQDPNDMNNIEIEEALNNKILSVNYFLNKSNLFENIKIAW
jgi:hypothetical protein